MVKLLGLPLTRGELGTDNIEAVLEGIGVLGREAAECREGGWTRDDIEQFLHDVMEIPENQEKVVAMFNSFLPAAKEVTDLSWQEAPQVGGAALGAFVYIRDGYKHGEDDPPVNQPE